MVHTVLVKESLREVNGRFQEWREALEGKKLKINKGKKIISISILEKGTIQRIGKDNILRNNEDEINEVQIFKFIGSSIQKDGCFGKDINIKLKVDG